MDRELVFVILALLVLGALAVPGRLMARAFSSRFELNSPGEELERGAAWQLVAPMLPTLIGLSALVGWAIVEPENAERPPSMVLLMAVPAFFICVRAALRALVALRPQSVGTAATVGFLRPRVVLDPDFSAHLSDAERVAVLAHERAHARHRDPLRVWLAQIVTDLQWPLPEARIRFAAWRAALELARDDEARQSADGADLAAAVLAAARREGALALEAVGIASTDSPMLRARVERLLAPLAEGRSRHRFPIALVCAGAVLAAAVAGSYFGEGLVRGLFGR